MSVEQIQQFVSAHQTWFWLAGAVSGVVLVAMLVVIPVVLVRIPSDYFLSASRSRRRQRLRRRPVVNVLLATVKNLVGACLIVLGIVMLFTPGQGLVTILAGVALSNVPGKYRLERWLITRRPVWRTVTMLRRRANVSPLQLP